MITTGSIQYNENFAAKEHLYIVWLFRLLIGFFLLCVTLLFTVRINDTVSFNSGEIIASNPQADIKAPFEAQLAKIYVKEGEQVKAGDTLMVIHNEQNERELIKQQAEKEYLEKKLASTSALFGTIAKKKNEVGTESNLNNANHNVVLQNITNNLQTLKEQYALQQQKLISAKERLKADSVLFKKDMISKLEYNSDKDFTSSIQEEINTTYSEILKQQTQTTASSNELLQRQQNVRLQSINLDENQQNMHQVEIELQNNLTKTNENIALLNKELAKEYIIAASAGTVNFIYNVKQSSNLLNKGDLLLSISPAASNSFYAKAALPENNIQYVKTNMPAHLKLDAYYHLEYGIIKGQVTYISVRKENDKFYALIALDNANHFQLRPGYNISGEIITDRLLLVIYFIKKLFKEFDSKQS